MEPLFCKITLFDIALEKRISEDFCFNMNSKDTFNLLNSGRPAELVTLCQRALFYVSASHRSRNLHLMLQVNYNNIQIFYT